jgi:hypothetical protein
MRLFSGSVLALLVMSCSGSTEPGMGLRMVLSLDRTEVARPDSIEVTLQVINESGRTVRAIAPESYGMCFHAFQVADAAGRAVSIPEALCALLSLIGPQPIDLAPGASVTVKDLWWPGSSSLDGQPLPAGTYRLNGVYHAENKALITAPAAVTLVR